MRLAAWSAALVLAGACAGRPGPVFELATGDALRWPEPPARGRVAWVGELRAARGGRLARLRRDRGRGGYVRPHGVGLRDGALCVADPGARVVWVHAAGAAGRAVGQGALVTPIDCAFLPGDRLAVSDSAARAVVAFDAKGRVVWRSAPGELARPTGLAVDGAGERLLVADAKAHRLVAMDFTGRVTATIGGRGEEPGRFNFPTALTVAADGTIYVLDALNFRVQVLTADGVPRRAFGTSGDGPGTFLRPRGIGVDRAGRIYVADALFDNVQIFDAEGRLLLALGRRGRRPGEFSMPAGVAVGPGGRLHVADAYNRRVQVFELLDAPPAVAGEGAPP